MKVVILAGGLGTRLSEETDIRPKPMVEIDGRPILWHIMKIYSLYGFNEFVICLGYKGYSIKEYFNNYFLHQSDVCIDLISNSVSYTNSRAEQWKIHLVETGQDTLTGSRIKKIQSYIDTDTFLLTYGDGVADININKLVSFHKSHGKLATVTAVQPSGRFGSLGLTGSVVSEFQEKKQGDGSWVNGGFFVLHRDVFGTISDTENVIFERGPLEKLASSGNLHAYKHSGFWRPMDTLRDKIELNELCKIGTPCWLKKSD